MTKHFCDWCGNEKKEVVGAEVSLFEYDDMGSLPIIPERFYLCNSCLIKFRKEIKND